MSVRILVIEDNPANLELMSYLLEAGGYEPVTACNGEEGLQAALESRPAVIACDVQLPGMNGYQVARRLENTPGLSAIPRIAVTALAMVGDRDKALAAGQPECPFAEAASCSPGE